ncbi:MAG TPA: phage tail family protein [Anaerolineales bacterium]|nr:phage tail family protein [Anaerolineales bacterium]
MSAFTKYEIVRNGVATDVSDAVEWLRGGDDGFGLPDIEPLVEVGPNQDGSTDKGFRLKSRVINLALNGFPAARGAEYWDFRERWLKLVKPTDVRTVLRVTAGSWVREIVVKTIGGSKLARKQGQGLVVSDGVQLMAHDPTWYDPAGVALSFAGGAGGTGTPVPLIVPMTVGASDVNVSVPHGYQGTWRAFPVVRITGPVTNAVVLNTTTGMKLDFTGYTIPAGEWIEVDCAYDKKTVVDQAGANQISRLTSDSDLVGFAFEADPEAPDGINVIQVTGSAASAATKIDITYLNRYIGI